MATEDFSFPAINDTLPRFIDSPPLWSSPSLASPKEELRRSEGDDEQQLNLSVTKSFHNSRRKSFWFTAPGVQTTSEDGSDSEDEKMDILWEEFNEEEQSKSFESGPDSDMSTGRRIELGCVNQGLKLSKSGGNLVSRKGPSFVVFVKVLKKLFLLHNAHRSKKTHSW